MTTKTASRFCFGLLLSVLAFSTAAAVRSSPWEAEYRKAREVNFHESGGPKAALKLVEAALARAGSSDDRWVLALRIFRAELLAQTGDSSGTAILERPLPPRLRATEIEIRRRIALAMVRHFGGKKDEAKRIAEETVALAVKKVPAFAADAYALRGTLTGNEDDVRAAIRLARAAGDQTLALRSEAMLVRTFDLDRRYDKAVEIGERILPRFEAAKLREAGIVAGNVGSAYYGLGDYESSKEYFLRSVPAARRIGTVNDLPVWLDRLGDVHLATHDLDGAEKWYREAEAVARQYKHRQLPRALSNLAQVAIRRGNLDLGRKWIEEAIALDTRDSEIEDVLRARVIRASLNTAAGQYDVARKEFEEVIAATPAWRLQARAGLGRLYAAQKKNEQAERYFALAVKMAIEERAAIDREHRFSYFNSVEDLFDDYVDFLVANGEIEKALEVTEQSRARMLAEGLGVTAPAKKLDPRAIAKRVNATILSYWLGTRRSYVWTVTAAGVAIHQLPPAAELERELDRYAKLLERCSLSECAPRGKKLFETLAAPAVRGVAQSSRVIVIADGKLHTLNFETLVVATPRPHWWIDDVVLTSASSLHLLGQPAEKRTAEPALLLVGDTPRADPAFAPLPHAGAEMQEVASHFPRKKVLRGPAATPQAFLDAAPATFDVIHFVAHGIATRRRPLDSAVILAKEKNDRYKLLASDIVKQRLNARLVTISSCHGAGTRAYAGEGLVGLAWAFLRGGAEQVIAALWEVDDAAAAKLMNLMYGRIRAGQDPAVALRDAKRALIQSGTSQQKPKYWAPFVIYSGS